VAAVARFRPIDAELLGMLKEGFRVTANMRKLQQIINELNANSERRMSGRSMPAPSPASPPPASGRRPLALFPALWPLSGEPPPAAADSAAAGGFVTNPLRATAAAPAPSPGFAANPNPLRAATAAAAATAQVPPFLFSATEDAAAAAPAPAPAAGTPQSSRPAESGLSHGVASSTRAPTPIDDTTKRKKKSA
jgi:hypothetical protein